MNKEKMSKLEVLKRLNYFVENCPISRYEISLRLGNNDNYMSRVLNGWNNLSMNKFLDILEILELTPEEFFAADYKNYKQNAELLELVSSLNDDEKASLSTILKKK